MEAESINLSSNAFKTFPKELSKFSNLKTIDLSNNPIKSLGGKYTDYSESRIPKSRVRLTGPW